MGNLVLAVFLLLLALTYFGVAIPPVILGLAAGVAGILLLVGR